MPAPRVSVVVPHYNDPAGLALCLASLTAQTLPRDQFEIVVADNDSPIGAEAVERAIAGRARMTVVTEKGAGPARNGGVAMATGEILAFIDSDCVAEPEWLVEGLRALADHDFVGGRVKVSAADPARPTPSEAFEAVFAFNFQDYIERKGFTGSGNMFVPRRIFDAVGGFRKGVSEDIEWSHRARGMGYRLGYASAAVISHPGRRTWRELVAKNRRINQEMFLLARERRGGRLRYLARTWALPPSAILHTPRVITSAALPDWGARRRALVTLYRLRLWRFADGNMLALRSLWKA